MKTAILALWRKSAGMEFASRVTMIIAVSFVMMTVIRAPMRAPAIPTGRGVAIAQLSDAQGVIERLALATTQGKSLEVMIWYEKRCGRDVV